MKVSRVNLLHTSILTPPPMLFLSCTLELQNTCKPFDFPRCPSRRRILDDDSSTPFLNPTLLQSTKTFQAPTISPPRFLTQTLADARRYFKQSEIVLYRQTPDVAAAQQLQAQSQPQQITGAAG